MEQYATLRVVTIVNKTIMVCDDSLDILEMTGVMLEMADYRVLTEADSTRLIARAITEKPDLLLLDLWMPILPGDKLAIAIRQTPELAHLPIIIFSAAIDGKSKAALVGVNYFVDKPFEMEKLLITILSALNNYQQPHA